MHIAIIAHHAESLLNFRAPWIRDLLKAGHRIVCLAPDYDAAGRAAIREMGAEPLDYRLRRTGLNPFREIGDALALMRMLRALHPDVVFSFSTKPIVYGTLAAWFARVPVRVAMVEGVGFVFTESEASRDYRWRLLRQVLVILDRIALSRAERIIFLNADDREEFVARGLVRAERTVVLGGIGVDLAEWPCAPAVRSPVTFLLVGRILREKGILDYVTAARLVRQSHPDVRFLLVGGLDANPGSLSVSAVQAWVDEKLLEWPGHTDVRPWLARASVFVLPSYREGVPRSTQEAMAMGRPVITTDAPGCRDTVVDGVNGYLVPVRDPAALAQAMLRFIEDPDSIAVMGRESRRLAEERFDVHEVNARLTRYVLGSFANPEAVAADV